MITPNELKNKEFKKKYGGYNKEDVDEYFALVASEFDSLYRENIALKDKITMLTDAVKEYKAMETALQNTIVTAQNVAEEVKKTAQLNAECIVKDAETKAADITRKAEEKVAEIMSKHESAVQTYAVYKSKIRTLVEGQIKYLDDLE